MRLDRAIPATALAVLLMAFGTPSLVLADHCGAGATVTPASGGPGTTFVFETNLGAAVDLSVYQNDALVIERSIDTEGPVRYAFTADAGSAGSWRVRAEVADQGQCFAEATFTVTGTPDTSASTEPARIPFAAILVVLSAGLVSFGWSLRRSRVR